MHIRRLPSPARAVAAAALLTLLALGLSEFLLPGLVEQRVRDRLERNFGADVHSLQVDSSPALGAIVGGPDHVAFQIDDASASGGFSSAGKADQIDARFGSLSMRAVDARDVHFTKSGSEFQSSLRIPATVTLPGGRGGELDLTVTPDGGLEAAVLGVPIEIVPDGGAVVARPRAAGPLTRAFGSRTLMEPSALSIDQLHATEAGDEIELRVSGRVTV
jgi:hypothetical protein